MSGTLVFVVLAAISAGALAYALLFKSVESERKVGQRLNAIKRAETDGASLKASRDRLAEVARRRKSVQDSLKELEAKEKNRDQKSRKPPLKVQSPYDVWPLMSYSV